MLAQSEKELSEILKVLSKRSTVDQYVIDEAHGVTVCHTTQQHSHTPREVRGRPSEPKGGHRPLEETQMGRDRAQLLGFRV